MRRVPLVAAFVAAMLVATATVASANSPSNYDIASSSTITSSTSACSALKQPGVTAGLYGWCMAFCTTVDCPVTECTAGDARLLALYNAKMKASDPAMPCEVPVPRPPCWSDAELAAIGVSYSPNRIDFLWDAFGEFSGYSLWEIRIVTFQVPYGASMLAHVEIGPDYAKCTYRNQDGAPGSPDPIHRILTITREQGIAAQNEIAAHIERLRAAGLGVFCFGNACPIT